MYRDLIAFFGRFAFYDPHASWRAFAGVITQHCHGIVILHPGRDAPLLIAESAEADLASVALQLFPGVVNVASRFGFRHPGALMAE